MIFSLQKLLNIPLRKSHLLIHFGSQVPCLCPVTSTRSSTLSTWTTGMGRTGHRFAVLFCGILCHVGGWFFPLHVPLCLGSPDIIPETGTCCCKRSELMFSFQRLWPWSMSNNQNHHLVWRLFHGVTLPETNSSHLPGSHPGKETIVFQPSIFRCRPLVWFREGYHQNISKIQNMRCK